jgi:hypothetical protein
MRVFVVVPVAFLALVALARPARACGCFAPPSTSRPVIQAGERILFARGDDGVITAHIQIQYSGDADDFGWLLPLPAVPTLELGSDEVFTQLDTLTAPEYRLTRTYERCGSGASGASSGGCMGGTAAGASAPAFPAADARPAGAPVVSQDSIGPYDYAVLKADDRAAVLAWLAANHYYVPAGTGDVLGAYLHPGATFLALKLKSGESTGALRPVVVRYVGDLPMIPLVLTSVGAQPDMGIRVYVLGPGRAIPRNYAHTVLNDAAIDWLNGAANYQALVVRATREADGRRTFITELAGPAAAIGERLLDPARLGSLELLAAQPGIEAFARTLWQRPATRGADGQLSALAADTLSHLWPLPAPLVARGVDARDVFLRLSTYRALYPDDFVGWNPVYDGAAAAAEIERVFWQPVRAAQDLFRAHPVVTRLYTTLSPEDMTRDPVFTWSKALGGFANVHQATLTYHCDGAALGATTPATLETEQGYVVSYPHGTAGAAPIDLPGSRRIEVLSEDLPPAAIIDNDERIVAALAQRPPAAPAGPEACAVAGSQAGGLAPLLVLIVWRLRRRAVRRPPPC